MARGKKDSPKERQSKIAESASYRRSLYKDFLKHIESGRSTDCFYALSIKQIEVMFEKYPDEWIEEEMHESIRKAKDSWESIGQRQANGTCIGNSRSWFYNMANRYGWSERSKVETDVKGSVTVSIVKYAD